MIDSLALTVTAIPGSKAINTDELKNTRLKSFFKSIMAKSKVSTSKATSGLLHFLNAYDIASSHFTISYGLTEKIHLIKESCYLCFRPAH